MKKVVFILLISCVFALKAQETKLVVPGFHTSIVKSIAISGDNIYVATTSTDHSLKVWEYATGRLLTEFICEEDAKSCASAKLDVRKRQQTPAACLERGAPTDKDPRGSGIKGEPSVGGIEIDDGV